MATGIPSISSIVGGLNIGSDHELRPMKTGKASGWGQEYTWVELEAGPDTPPDLGKEALEWCCTTMGRPGQRWFEKKMKFYFKSEKDLSMFILRWV